MNAIRLAVEELGIPFLVHFTRTSNLPSIFEHGIVPRQQLDLGHIAGTANDELRLDNQLGASCFSIAFPNAKMLYKLRQENPGTRWAVLIVDRSILWNMPCAFCPTNAAAASVTCHPVEHFCTADALQALYADDPTVNRQAQKLKPSDPNDVQAEVLAFGTVPPERILGGVFQRTPSRDQYLNLFGNRKTWVHGDQGFFSQRWYYRGGTAN